MYQKVMNKHPRIPHRKPSVEHSPTLNTIRMVEKALGGMDESLITVAGLKRILPHKVNHNTLKEILRYLEESGKIFMSVDGITWVYNNNPTLRRLISTGREVLRYDPSQSRPVR